MDFVKSYFGKNEPVEHFCPPCHQHRSGKKGGTKVFNWSEVHFYQSTSSNKDCFVDIKSNFTVDLLDVPQSIGVVHKIRLQEEVGL